MYVCVLWSDCFLARRPLCASISRGPRTTDGSQRSHVLNPVCRWTPVVVLNPARLGSTENTERPIHHRSPPPTLSFLLRITGRIQSQVLFIYISWHDTWQVWTNHISCHISHTAVLFKLDFNCDKWPKWGHCYREASNKHIYLFTENLRTFQAWQSSGQPWGASNQRPFSYYYVTPLRTT